VRDLLEQLQGRHAAPILSPRRPDAGVLECRG
jgi:hypothetical protein